jgi:hypothetical protein
MYVIFDSTTETMFGPFNDYESAQMFVLYASEDLLDGGANLSIESVSEPAEWAMDNNINIAIAVD